MIMKSFVMNKISSPSENVARLIIFLGKRNGFAISIKNISMHKEILWKKNGEKFCFKIFESISIDDYNSMLNRAEAIINSQG